MHSKLCSRRHLIESAGFGLASIAAATLLQQDGLLAADGDGLSKPVIGPQSFDMLPKQPPRPARAKAMISMFMIGGPSQMDLFDPKPELIKRDGQEYSAEVVFDNAAQASRKLMGPIAKFRPRGACGMQLSDLVPHLGDIADDITLIRSMHSDVNNHLPAMYALNTGAGSRGRATLGAWITQSLGSMSQELPAFVALTHPSGMPLMGSENWSNGALPSLFQGTVVRPTEPRMLNLDPPPRLRGTAQKNQLDLIAALNQSHLENHPGEDDLAARMASYQLAARMQVSAREAFDLSSESAATLEMYGINNKTTQDYGTRCLIARRLVERGVRFVQIFNNGQSWDHHESIATALPQRCAEIDQPAAALVKDLKQRGMLDETLVQFTGEMGRLPVIQIPAGNEPLKRVGRDHNTFGFSQWVAGGGMKSGYVHGATDETGFAASENKVHVHDLHATMLHLLGIDHERLTYRYAGRDFRLTDVHGRVVKDMLS
ncbi:MAG: DUF1501 domain-containing protein [Planctomycetaceae bacterium]|nr:DUF1501 domain-containing protein [Planctomycetaceae bacterium]